MNNQRSAKGRARDCEFCKYQDHVDEISVVEHQKQFCRCLCVVWLLTKLVKRTMTRLLNQLMYVGQIDFEALNIIKIVDLVFTDMIRDKIVAMEDGRKC